MKRIDLSWLLDVYNGNHIRFALWAANQPMWSPLNDGMFEFREYAREEIKDLPK